MSTVTVAMLAQAVKLNNLTPEIDLNDVEIRATDTNRPSLQLAGFYEYFDADRVQIVGNMEMAYLETLGREKRLEAFERLFSHHIPCVVFCCGQMPGADVLQAARARGIPLLATRAGEGLTSYRVIHYTRKWMSPTLVVHGVLVDVFGEGVLITGESGIGKSEAALELVKRGHRLVADDAVELRKMDDEMLIGRAPSVTKDFIELRGIGVIDVKNLFGIGSIKTEQMVDLVIHFEEWSRDKDYDRLGDKDEYVEYLGNRIRYYSLPVRPGRNLAVIVEAVAINNRQRFMGYNATREFYKRVQDKMNRDL